jgi:16S rRNA (uracil1498-N3)-methyltransferase
MSTTHRLYVDADLSAEATLRLGEDAARYLVSVLRLGPGQTCLVFNGRDGEWVAHLEDAGKRTVSLKCLTQSRTQDSCPAITLAFAPIKGDRIDAVAEKATELGAVRLQPVITERTIVRRINVDRLRARCREAAEQTGRLSVPDVREPVSLERYLADRDPGELLIFADEARDDPGAASGRAPPLVGAVQGRILPAALLIGPEGGFTHGERSRIRDAPGVIAVSLGPRILRADTAAFAGLAVLQSVIGDWR